MIKPNELAARLKARREHLGFTQDAVATRAHVSRQTYAGYESPDDDSSARMKLSTLYALADVLQCQAWELLTPEAAEEPGVSLSRYCQYMVEQVQDHPRARHISSIVRGACKLIEEEDEANATGK